MPRVRTAIAVAFLFAAPASAAGPVVAWGSNVYGQRAVPTTLGPCLAVEAGAEHTLAIKTNGAVVAWGNNEYGQRNVPATLGTCVMVDAGVAHSLALRSNGTVAAWGYNFNGQGTVPAALGPCTRIAAGGYHNLAIRSGGTVAAWGENFDGQCAVPAGLGTCTAIAAGTYHSLAIRSSGLVAAWGLNDYNQALVPSTLGTVIAIAAGESHNAAVRSNGGVSCWGYNGQAQCNVPSGLKASTAVACGAYHTVALQQDGTVVAWGLSDFGQCTVPSTLPKSTQVAAGGSHTAALTTNVVAPTGVAATDGTSLTNVTVTWNAVSGATGYRVFRAVGTGLGAQIATSPGATTFVDSTAVAGVGYAYWVKTTTALGDSAASVADAGWRNMAAPTNLAASDGTSSSGVNLTWTAVTGVTGYRVFRASGTASATQVGTTLTATFADTTAVAGTLYTYTVKSAGTGGDSAASSSDTGWRGPTLPAPSGLAATDGTRTDGVELTWNAVSGVAGYKVFRAIGTGTATQLATPTTATFLDTTATPGIVYTYTVKSRTSTADSAASASNTGWRTVAAPTNVQATDGTSTANVSITWSAVSGTTGYKVFRAAGTAAPAQLGGTLAATVTSLTDTTAVAGTLYSYTVKATCAAGDSAASTANTGWRNIAAPTGTAATDGTSTANVTITWNAATGATGYKVFRAIGSGAATQVGTTTSAVRTLADTLAVAGTLYTYTVKATTAAGDSLPGASNTGWRNVTAPTGVVATDGSSTEQVRVTWVTHANTGVTGYKVYRTIGSTTTLVDSVASRTTTATVDITVPQVVVASYTVKAQTAAGESAASTANTGWRNVPAPTGLTASDGLSPDFVSLGWTASTSTAVTGYRVVRMLPGETVFATIATVTGRTNVTYFDGSIPAGVQGTYAVHAQVAPGESARSATDVGFKASTAAMRPPSGGAGGEGDGGGDRGGRTPGSNEADGEAGDGTDTGNDLPPALPGPADGVDVTCTDVLGRIPVLADWMRGRGHDADADRLEALLPGAPASSDADAAPSADCPACRALAGDLTLDGTVDAQDLDAFVEAWRAGDAVAGDLDRDGTCDGRDLVRLLSRIGAAPLTR